MLERAQKVSGDRMQGEPKGFGPASIYQIKVTLSGSRPPIWRRLQLPGNLTLGRLHEILQIAMGWQDMHLHLFASGRTVLSKPASSTVAPIRMRPFLGSR